MSAGPRDAEASPQLATFGDSLSTGAATHPALAFDSKVLWDVFNGAVSSAPRTADLPPDLAATLPDPPPPPVRLWPGTREFFGGPDWIWRNTLLGLSRVYLDTAEYSWSYLLGLGLGLSPDQIELAGQDGARMMDLPRHVDRVLDADGGVLPPRLVIFYTGNDLCGTSIEQTTPADEFASDLERGLRYIARNGRAAPGGTDVYVLGYLGILQLLTSDQILAKETRAFGGHLTCRELRQSGFRAPDPEKASSRLPPEAWWFGAFMPPNPAAICTTLFGPTDEPGHDALVSSLANRIRDYRESEQAVVGRLNGELAGSGLRLHYVHETAEVTFTGDDIAQDCFHLSVSGQAKVARAALAGIKAAR